MPILATVRAAIPTGYGNYPARTKNVMSLLRWGIDPPLIASIFPSLTCVDSGQPGPDWLRRNEQKVLRMPLGNDDKDVEEHG